MSEYHIYQPRCFTMASFNFLVRVVFVRSCLGLRLDQNILANNGIPQWQIGRLRTNRRDVTGGNCNNRAVPTVLFKSVVWGHGLV